MVGSGDKRGASAGPPGRRLVASMRHPLPWRRRGLLFQIVQCDRHTVSPGCPKVVVCLKLIRKREHQYNDDAGPYDRDRGEDGIQLDTRASLTLPGGPA